MLAVMNRIWFDENGQGMVEYGLILALIAVVVIIVLTSLGGKIKEMFQKVFNGLNGINES